MKPGDRLAHYQITAQLGAGGMGEIWAARDTKLDRSVAIKVLPSDLALDPERRERFEREAKAIAALNHANIVTVYSVEEAVGPSADGPADAEDSMAAPGDAQTLHFITMELVEGKTLGELIPPGGMSLEKFFAIAIPLADALSAAHGKGIAHRDLKPGNVMVTDEGAVKLLDFGLAKLFEQEGGLQPRAAATGPEAATQMATEHAGAAAGATGADLTEEGKVLGTVAYMSPEQAEGKPIDHRSDVFSLGIILYEMATGRRPFSGDTKLSVMSSIVKDTPASVTDVNVQLPRHLGRIIRRALEKDVTRRFQTALDLRNEIEDLKREVDSGEVLVTGVATPVETAPARQGRLLPAAIGVLAIAVVAVGWWMTRGAPEREGGAGPRVSARAIASTPALEFVPSISPDGRWVVYAALPGGATIEDAESDPDLVPDLILQNIDGQTRINLTNTPDHVELESAYSPDGTQIAYHRDGPDGHGIFVMGATGENPRRVSDTANLGSWTPDGTKLVLAQLGFNTPRSVSGTSELYLLDVATGERTLLFGYDGWTAMQPSVSPDGTRVAFWALTHGGQRDIWTVPISGGDPVPVTADAALDFSPMWAPDGKHLYFASDRSGSTNIWRVPIDQGTGEPQGEPEPLTTGGFAEQGRITISADGSRLAYMEFRQRTPVVHATFDAETLTVADDGAIISNDRVASYLMPSPDGRRVAYNSLEARQDLYVMNIDGSGERRITDDLAKDWRPRWLADNETLMFYSDADGGYDLWRIRADGSGRVRLTETAPDDYEITVAPDGSFVLAAQRGVDATAFIEIGDTPAASTTTYLPQVPDAEARMLVFSVSPDGRWLAGSRRGILLYDVQEQRFDRLTDRGVVPRFVPDGSGLLYRIGGGPFFEWWIVDIATRESRQLTLPRRDIPNLWILAGNESVVYSATDDTEADVWLLEIEEGGR